MKKGLKRVLISLVVVLIVALVGVAIFLLTFDPNSYKSKVEQLVYERYHRTLAIEGDIELSLFPRIGLAVQDVSLSNRDSTGTFVSINSARFAVAIWPLLFNRLVVDHVAVTDFKVWLVRDTQGRFNFSDLVWSTSSPALSGGPEPVNVVASSQANAAVSPTVMIDKDDFQIDIAGLDLKAGEIHFLDQETGTIGRLENLDVNTGRMTFDQAFDVSLKGKLVGDRPQADAQFAGQALMRINPRQREYSAQRIDLSVKGQLGELMARSATLKGNLAYSEYSQMLSASNLEFQVQGDIENKKPVKNLEASLLVPKLRVDRSRAELQVTRLALRAKGTRVSTDFDVALDAPAVSVSPETAMGEPVTGTFKTTTDDRTLGVSLEMVGLGGSAFDLTLKELKLDSVHKQDGRLVSVQVSSPATWSPFGRRGGLSAMKGDMRIEDATLPAGSFEFPFIGSMKADVYKDELSSEISAVLSGSKIEFNLSASQLDNPRIVFDLSTDSIDLNALFPPPPAQSSVEQDEDHSDSTSSDKQASEKAEAPSKPARPARQFDWSILDSAHVQGKLNAGALKAGGIDLTSISASVDAQDGLLTVRDIKADLYGGSLESNVSFSSKHDVTLDLVAANVDSDPVIQAVLSQRRMSGIADVDMKLASQGITLPALISGLGGTVNGQVRDGALTGLNLGQTITEANAVLRNAFSGQLPDIASRFDAGRRTDFNRLDIQLIFENGQGTVNALTLKSPSLQVTGGSPASIDLVNQQLDVMLNVRAQADREKSDADFAGLDRVVVPVRVSGPFDTLSYQVQWKAIRDHVVKDAIQDGLLDILSQGAEGSKNYFLLTPPNKSDKTKSGTNKHAPLRSIGDALKGLLKP